jgi:hypothetical protein
MPNQKKEAAQKRMDVTLFTLTNVSRAQQKRATVITSRIERDTVMPLARAIPRR